ERTLVRIGEDFALLRVLFPDEALRTPEPFLLRERLIGQALRIAGLEVAISGLVDMAFYSGLGDVSGFRVEAYGPSYDGLAEVAEAFARDVEADPRVAGVDVNAGRYGDPPGREVLRFRWEAEAVARTGVQAGELSELLRARLFTWAPSFHTPLAGDRRMSVRMLAAGSEDQQLARLEQSFLAPRTERQIRLADLSALSLEKEPPAIEREDQQYKRYIEVFYRGPQRIGQEMIDREILALRLPPGYRVERPRFSLLTRETKRELLWTLAATLGLVFLIIAGLLESWRMAACALLCVPMAWVGVALGFLGSGESFAEGAFLGSILTIGLAVNSGILLADRYRRLRLARPSTPRDRLALLAVRSRLRPLWITTVISVTGMLPVLLVPGAQAFWKGLAVTVVGGLLSSSLLAPIAMAALISPRLFYSRPPSSVSAEK
ncbi:MAG TPA: efflux RND transporter permease subunit, partial [Thermoanaerobaculia bacterium]|nr:efflux RND transporter permease subunit [Thermoanaerobaculia bacterium]